MSKERIIKKITYYFRYDWLRYLITAILCTAIFFSLTYSNVYMEAYDIEKFSSAKETIRSPITVENTKETERRIREAVQSVEDHYEISTDVTEEQVASVNEIFEVIEKIESEDLEKVLSKSTITVTDKVNYLKQLVEEESVREMNSEVFTALFKADSADRMLAKELISSSLYDVFHTGVKVDEEEQVIKEIEQKLSYSTLDYSLVQALEPLIVYGVEPNSFFSADQTNEAQKLAREGVEPVLIRAGEMIVEEGQLITNEIYEELEITGLLNEERNVFPLIGLLILMLLLGMVIFLELNRAKKNHHYTSRKLAAIVILTCVIVGVMKVISFYVTTDNPLFFITPIATVSMLVKILIRERVAIVFSIIYAIVGSVIFNANIPGLLNMEAGIYFLITQLVSIYFLALVKDKAAIIKTGIGLAFMNLTTVFLFLLLSFEKYDMADYLLFGSYGFLAAIIATVLTVGMLPFFESGLGILSDSRLLTLSSPNQPLLRKLLIEAPGTYHHSIMVANLSEASCEAIGANGLLARVAAYYHDLGKTVRPHYFIENQMGMKNPHDYLDPYQSAEIIMQHPVDGAELLKKEKLPQEIIDIALQHHGTTLLKFFYYKAKDKSDNVLEEDFRYSGPKPATKEAAVVSICDSIEAAVRSQTNPDQKQIEKIVASIFEDRMLDGQLDDSKLTFKDLEIMKNVICETLKGIYHSRIQYPNEEKMKEAK
ncbi:HDIG domain-containing protein [Gracilibacillus oryzae]|uniref:HDIG domain-containing protein n=1 Tax=Gracilibacillus oryzae TaxID=1672701 RepID=A0A7C8KXU5_9BACI|nr:HDIG domain-containing metalloprotein [Gracilibacillus oryzae]KAB8128731.1 HDIG domain-containing protein [Gracilibacillus oryzae]